MLTEAFSLQGYVEDPRFVYYARVNNTFALSGQDRRIEAILKVFNFNILSDRNASIILRLTPAQLQGEQNVTFPMDIGAIADKYFAGGRLYFEVCMCQLFLWKPLTCPLQLSTPSVRLCRAWCALGTDAS